MLSCEFRGRYQRLAAQHRRRHTSQPVAQKALLVLRDRGETVSIFPQNLVEFWAVATRPLMSNGLGWDVGRTKQELTDLKKLFALLPDTEAILPEWERLVFHHRVIGKQAHDTRLVAAMLINGVTNLLTFNTVDFKRFSEITVVSPQSVT
jgi:predicted nucleic acid-binding protein